MLGALSAGNAPPAWKFSMCTASPLRGPASAPASAVSVLVDAFPEDSELLLEALVLVFEEDEQACVTAPRRRRHNQRATSFWPVRRTVPGDVSRYRWRTF